MTEDWEKGRANTNFTLQSTNSGIIAEVGGSIQLPDYGISVKCDEANNSKEDIEEGRMNVDVCVPILSFNEKEVKSTLEEITKIIRKSCGIPKHLLSLNIPEENDGGIGQEGLE